MFSKNVPSKMRFTAFLSFLLMGFSVLFFQACRKENFYEQLPNAPTSTQIHTPTITLEEVKDWYTKTLAEETAILSFTGDTIILKETAPEWTASTIGFNKNEDEFFFEPLNVKSDEPALFNLLVARNDNGMRSLAN